MHTRAQESVPLPRSFAPRFTANAVVNDKFDKVSLDAYLEKGSYPTHTIRSVGDLRIRRTIGN